MNREFTNDIHLISALKEGNIHGYQFLVRTYNHTLCVYAYNLTHDHDLAKDIVQNVFMNIWKNRSKLKEDFAIKGYLYKSVYNEFIDQYRKHKNVFALEQQHIDALTYIIEENDDTFLNRLTKIIKKGIDKLPPKCKKIFLLSKKEGLTNIEIAEYLNISIKSVEAHITKAFNTLRNQGKLK